MESGDFDLLADYAENGSQRAFAELVRRHLDLVYSAALRQVRAAHVAEEVTQSVFLDLSRSASQIKPNTSLVAWLYTVTRRTAIDVIRKESRRTAREQEALEIAAMKSPDSEWERVEPLLDEAMETLKENDRAALLLRFFENRSLREVGERLGMSEDTAQKRVSRAVDRLRRNFAKRGIVLTAAGLSADLSAHAVQAAPSTLSPAISAAAGALGKAALAQTAATFELGRTLAMTSFPKTLLAAAAVATVGVAVYETREALLSRRAVRNAEHAFHDASAELRLLQEERDSAQTKLQGLERKLDAELAAAARKAEDAPIEAEMRAWLDRAQRLQQLRGQRADLLSPELELLDADDWFVTAKDAQLETDSQIRDVFKSLRYRAENVMAERIRSALSAFREGTAGEFPTEMGQLLPFFDPPLKPAMLDRYEIVPTDKSDPRGFSDSAVVVTTKYPVDAERDAIWRVGSSGFMSIGAFLYDDMRNARKAFALAHQGKPPQRAEDLLPYLKWLVPIDTVKKHFPEGRGP